MAAITTMAEKVRNMNSPQNTGTAGPDLGVLLPEAAPNPNLPRGQIAPERFLFTDDLHRRGSPD
jgi:hypothetical protein